MTLSRSFSAWWLFFSVPATVIAISPVVGVVLLVVAAVVMLVAQ